MHMDMDMDLILIMDYGYGVLPSCSRFKLPFQENQINDVLRFLWRYDIAIAAVQR
jgi:hypothetical protein